MGGRNSVVEYLLPKQRVVGSNPIARSIFFIYPPPTVNPVLQFPHIFRRQADDKFPACRYYSKRNNPCRGFSRGLA